MSTSLRRRSVLRLGVGVSGLALLSVAGVPHFAPGPVAAEGFTLNGFVVEEPFATYWREQGALAQQGLPISNRFPEKSTVNGQTYSVQYFERAVFELHPEYAGSENEVLLQLLGREQYLARYPNGAPGQEPNTSPGSVLFEETGKRLGGPFLAYWQSNGGLRQQGLPLTDEFLEVSPTNGLTYRVQYFERARFEWHPENLPPYQVLLGLLGSEQFLARYPNGQPGGGSVPPPPPPVGNVTYAANWSGGLAGWDGGDDWRVAAGMLTNDGSSGSDPSFILAPAKTPVEHYAVEAEIQVLNSESSVAAAGILVRRELDDSSGYVGGWGHDEDGFSVAIISTPGLFAHSGPEVARIFAPGGGWHSYRLELHGSVIRLLIDGGEVLAYSNDRYLSGVTTSLWSRGAQINVRSFRIVAL
jgi:hypothetical protein